MSITSTTATSRNVKKGDSYLPTSEIVEEKTLVKTEKEEEEAKKEKLTWNMNKKSQLQHSKTKLTFLYYITATTIY